MKRTSFLFDYSRDYNGIPWKYSKNVKMDDKIPFYQVLYALSEILGKFLYKTIMQKVESIDGFSTLFKEDEFDRFYVRYEDYKKYAYLHKKTFKLDGVKKKEVDLWLLRL